jgi:hypothetical protein
MTSRVWTPEMDARLRELHAEGLKFRLIAAGINAEFETTLTRNSCIGRAHRLNLPVRAKPTEPVKKSKRERGQYKARLAPIPPPVQLRQSPPLIPGRLTMLQLTRFTCRWPSGDRPPYTYCGDKIAGGGPFCREHAELAYNKSWKAWS